METLEYPTIDTNVMASIRPVAANKSNRDQLALTNVREVALARFGDWRPAAEKIVAKFKDVLFDTTKPKEYKALIEAIAEVRAPRYAAQNVSEESKSELAQVSKAVGAELAEVKTFLASTEAALLAQKDAHDARVKAEKEAAARIEDQRKEKHEAGIARIRSYAAQAQGKSSELIGRGIAFVEALTFSAEDWEEFAVPAANAQCETLEAMRALLRITTEREEEAAQAEANRIELARVAAEQLAERNRLAEEKRQADARQKEADDKLAADRAEFEREKAEFAARQAAAAAPAPEPATVVPATLTLASQDAEPVTIGGSLTPPVFDGENENHGTVPADFPQVATPEGDKGPADFDVQVADPIGSAIYLADGDIDTLLTDCLDLVTFAAAGLRTKQSAQKTTPEYWAGLRMRINDLQPRLLAALEA